MQAVMQAAGQRCCQLELRILLMRLAPVPMHAVLVVLVVLEVLGLGCWWAREGNTGGEEIRESRDVGRMVLQM